MIIIKDLHLIWADLQFLTLKTIIIKMMMMAAVPLMSRIITATRRPRMAAVLSELPRVVDDEVITVTGAAIKVTIID